MTPNDPKLSDRDPEAARGSTAAQGAVRCGAGLGVASVVIEAFETDGITLETNRRPKSPPKLVVSENLDCDASSR